MTDEVYIVKWSLSSFQAPPLQNAIIIIVKDGRAWYLFIGKWPELSEQCFAHCVHSVLGVYASQAPLARYM